MAKLKCGDKVSGFVVTRVEELEGMRSVGYLLTHEKSGAELMHIENEDPEKLIAIGFRTPPYDDTGLPHILEHTVLCGSEKFPVKDPFVELLKCSLATFLNAMTYPDKTVYPCASLNERDFFNLAQVYCDAVFHPRIIEEHFKQEGHHFDFETPGDTSSPLTIKGIVYNEMKGAYSDLDGTINRHTARSICPDNAYGKSAGGEPENIPELKYEDFVAFHRRYYHPSNARIFSYGNLEPEKICSFLDSFCLNEFDRIDIDTSIAEQPRWTEPVRETKPYPVGPEDELEKKTAITINFLANSATDGVTTLAMHLLDTILLDNSASPLRKALIDSKLGTDLTSSGYDDYQRDTCFTIGMKGSEPEKADALYNLVIKVCRDLCDGGIPQDQLERALHQLQLSSLETTGEYPLVLMDRVYRTWMYDADPFSNLRLTEQLAVLREKCLNEKGFLEGILRSMIVENPHYSILIFTPDREELPRRDAAFADKMTEVKKTLSEEDLKKIADEATKLEAAQAEPNSAEALATLPRLGKADIPKEPIRLGTKVMDLSGQDLLYTDVFANSLSYLLLALDISGLDDDLVDWLPLFADATRKMGAAGHDYARMAELEADCCAGVSTGLSISGCVNDPHHVQPFMTFGVKGLDSKLDPMFDVFSDRMLRADFTDRARLEDIIKQGCVQWRMRIVPAGHQYSALRAASNLSRNGQLAERTGGISQLLFYEKIAKDFDTQLDAIIEKLNRIREFVLSGKNLTASYVGDSVNLSIVENRLKDLLSNMSDRKAGEENQQAPELKAAREGMATPVDVSFVARAFPAPGALSDESAALLLLSLQLSYGYLWEEVRVKRGAYGGRAGYSMMDGVFSFASYRDPFIKETLDTYAAAIDYIENRMDLSDNAVEQAIIGTVKTLDRPIRPGSTVSVALSRHLAGSTDAFRAGFRQKLLNLTGDDIRRTATEILRPNLEKSSVCVISSREKLDIASAKIDGGLSVTNF